MTTAHFCHGFNVSDGGKNTTDRLLPYFQSAGFNVFEHDYGWLGLLGVRLYNRKIADRVAENVKDGDIGVGHSNGCTILTQSAAASPLLRGLVLINPALPRDQVFPDTLDFVHVYHSDGDLAVVAAVALHYLPWNWSVWSRRKHQWGDMGRVGYKGADARVMNVDTGRWGHSDVFKHLDIWGATMALNASAALRPIPFPFPTSDA